MDHALSSGKFGMLALAANYSRETAPHFLPFTPIAGCSSPSRVVYCQDEPAWTSGLASLLGIVLALVDLHALAIAYFCGSGRCLVEPLGASALRGVGLLRARLWWVGGMALGLWLAAVWGYRRFRLARFFEPPSSLL